MMPGAVLIWAAISAIAAVGGPSPFPVPSSLQRYHAVSSKDGSVLVKPCGGESECSSGAEAWGTFYDAINETGWSRLDLHGNPNATSDIAQAYAVGFLEGALTAERIWWHWRNAWYTEFDSEIGALPHAVLNHLSKSDSWLRQQAADLASTDHYWGHIAVTLAQFDGLLDGYNRANVTNPSRQLTRLQLHALNSIGEMDDLLSALKHQGKSSIAPRGPGPILRAEGWEHKMHCSALVRWLPDASDILIGHDNWDDYSLMTRVVKFVDLPLTIASPLRSSLAASQYSLSGYPGLIYSNDDFYTLSSGLVVTETSNDQDNKTLWKHAAQPEGQVPEWLRNMVANRMAYTGAQWADTFVRYNNGLYNNQFMVLDGNRFIPGSKSLANGTLWIVETLPGTHRAADVTGILQSTGYWGSYNINYFDELRSLAGVQKKADKGHTECCDYRRCSRARIFARDAHKVDSLAGMQHILRYNDPWDIFVVKDAGHAIAARFDLVPDIGSDCSGATDTKISSIRQLSEGDLGFYGISSPTYENRRPFAWSGRDAAHCGKDDDNQTRHHEGLPDVWHFDWYVFSAKLLPPKANWTPMFV